MSQKLLRFQSSFLDHLILDKSISASNNYHPLLSLFVKPLEYTSMKSWNKDLPIPDLTSLFIQGYNKTIQLITSEEWRETQCKLMHRAYLPYVTLQDFSASKSCPFCKAPRPTLYHRLWSWPRISVYWDQILTFVQGVTNKKIHSSHYSDTSLCITLRCRDPSFKMPSEFSIMDLQLPLGSPGSSSSDTGSPHNPIL